MLKPGGSVVSVLFSKPTVVETSADVPKVSKPVVLDGKRLVGVDPGR
jgi:hypothetical protein